MTSDPELLFVRYLGGTATPEEVAELDRLLREEPALRDRFMVAAAEDLKLAELLSVERPVKPASRRSIAARKVGRSAASSWIWAAAAAAAFVVALVMVAGSGEAPDPIRPKVVRQPKPEPPKPPAPPRPAPKVDPAPVRVAPPARAPQKPTVPGRTAPPAPRVAPTPRVRKAPSVPVRPTVPKKAPTRSAVAVVVESLDAGVAKGKTLLADEGFETQAGAKLRLPDATEVELSPGTALTRISESKPGRTIHLDRGGLRALVRPQPRDAAMVFVTPHGRAEVLGTVLRLNVNEKETRLEVEEGKVRLVRGADGRSATVAAGQFARAGEGAPPKALPLVRTPVEAMLAERGRIVINFGPAGLALPEGTLNDAGEPFDVKRGYGWDARKTASGIAHRPGTGHDILRATHAWGGSRDEAETWRVRLPAGGYAVTVVLGDDREQGPQNLRILDRLVVKAKVTRPNEFIEIKNARVVLRNGELTLSIGAHGTNRQAVGKTGTKTDDTTLNYIVIVPLR